MRADGQARAAAKDDSVGTAEPAICGSNIDPAVVRDFGDEWTRFDQLDPSDTELRELFDRYFSIFPWDRLPPNPTGFDLGCGSGRWAAFVAPRVTNLHCIDASAAALDVAKRKLSKFENCELHHASVDNIPLADGSMDFGYSIGVLHHVPQTAAGIRSCVDKLKSGGVMLLYIYYAMENRPLWFRAIWKSTDAIRRRVSRLPHNRKIHIADLIAALIYYPTARTSLLLEKLGMTVENFPLCYYQRRSLEIMRNDALDRFGTRLEQRFTQEQIADMMNAAGLFDLVFSDQPPFWCAVGVKR